MKNRPFVEMAMLFLMVALVVANVWDFLYRPEHPISSVVVIILALLVVLFGFLHVFNKKAD
jgi:uncharacterized membrane protein